MRSQGNLPSTSSEEASSLPRGEGEAIKRWVVRHGLTIVANTSNKVKARVAHTITYTKCSMVVTYCSSSGTRAGYQRLIGRAKGRGVRM